MRDRNGNEYGPATGLIGILFAVIGGALGLAFIMTSPTPSRQQWIFDHIFRTPPDQIERFVIKSARAHQFNPLTNAEVVIDDPAHIRRVAEILLAAREVTSSHRPNKWVTEVEMDTHNGAFYFEVRAALSGDGTGTILKPSYNPDGNGWTLGSVRADGLDKILEDAVRASSPHRSGG
jgi:hypothetical protein